MFRPLRSTALTTEWSLAHAVGVHSGSKGCWGPHSTSRFSGQGSGQAEVVVSAGGGQTLGCRYQLCMAGAVVDTHIVVGSRASSKGQGQLQVHWVLWGPLSLACTFVAAGSHKGHATVEAGERSQGSDVQVRSWRG